MSLSISTSDLASLPSCQGGTVRIPPFPTEPGEFPTDSVPKRHTFKGDGTLCLECRRRLGDKRRHGAGTVLTTQTPTPAQSDWGYEVVTEVLDTVEGREKNRVRTDGSYPGEDRPQ